MTFSQLLLNYKSLALQGSCLPSTPINVINPFQVESNTSTLPPPGKPVDPTRDIETLVEDDSNLNNREDVVSRADTEDEGPQLGSVFPAATRSVSSGSCFLIVP